MAWGNEVPWWLIEMASCSEIIFAIICSLYDFIQGVTSIFLLKRHDKSQFTNRGKTFLDNRKECQKLYQITLINFIMNLFAVGFELYMSLREGEGGYELDQLRTLQAQVISVMCFIYYNQMNRVASIVTRKKKPNLPEQLMGNQLGDNSTQLCDTMPVE